MMMNPSSIILLIVLVSVTVQATAPTNILYEGNMWPATNHSPALLSPEGYTLNNDALKAEILYSITETYFRMYSACERDAAPAKKKLCFAQDVVVSTQANTTNFLFINYFGTDAEVVSDLNKDAARKQYFCPLVIKHNLAPNCDNVLTGLRNMSNLDDTHAYKLTGNWKTYGTDLSAKLNEFTTTNFWKNAYDMGSEASFSTTGRNAGPDFLVSAIMTAPQVAVSDSNNSKMYHECVTIVEYRNLLRKDAKNGESVEGPIFFVIGMVVRGARITATPPELVGGWTCLDDATDQARTAEVMILRVEGKHAVGFDGITDAQTITKDSHFDGVGFPIWYNSETWVSVGSAEPLTWINSAISVDDNTVPNSVSNLLDVLFHAAPLNIDVLESMRVTA